MSKENHQECPKSPKDRKIDDLNNKWGMSKEKLTTEEISKRLSKLADKIYSEFAIDDDVVGGYLEEPHLSIVNEIYIIEHELTQQEKESQVKEAVEGFNHKSEWFIKNWCDKDRINDSIEGIKADLQDLIDSSVKTALTNQASTQDNIPDYMKNHVQEEQQPTNPTQEIVKKAIKIATEKVRQPKCVREGTISKSEKRNRGKQQPTKEEEFFKLLEEHRGLSEKHIDMITGDFLSIPRVVEINKRIDEILKQL